MTDKPKQSLIGALGLGGNESAILAGLNNAAAASKLASAPAQGTPPIPHNFDPHIEMEGESAVAYIPHQIVIKPIYEGESETLLKSRARAELWKSMFK